MGFSISSAAFPQGSGIPREHSCDGKDESPALAWNDPRREPSLSRSCAKTRMRPEGSLCTGSSTTSPVPREVCLGQSRPRQNCPTERAGQERFREPRLRGPCPPPGKPHRYFFRLFALKGRTTLASGLGRKELLRAIEPIASAKVEVFGTYRR